MALAEESKHVFLASMERLHGRRLRRFLSARLRNASADTPDLMQEVYLRLLRIEHHDAIRNPQAYLFTIANHVLYQHGLRESGALETVALMEHTPRLRGEPECDPAEQIETEKVFEDIQQSLMKLSPKAHMVLVLSRCEGVPLREIGERLGVSRAMAAKYLAKALAHVRKRLIEMDGGA